MRFTRLQSALLTTIILSLSLNAYARTGDEKQPIEVVSTEQLADLKANKIIFSGQVRAVQGTMKILSDKIEITRGADNKLKSIIAYGNPVSFEQEMDDGKKIHAEAASLSYRPGSSKVVLEGKARIWQNQSSMQGERIEYNIRTQKMKAGTPSRSGRVISTFVPAELQK